MNKNTSSLVSVCTTFFSAERYIHRFLDSCLNQTYKNIEVVVVDSASVDGSEKIVREYAARDSRIKYFRSAENIGLTLSFMKVMELVRGDFVMLVGADDWLARDYVENGVRSFLEHPDAAGVVPKLVSLREVDDKFEFLDETEFPLKTYPAEWFIKPVYRIKYLHMGALALIRKKDVVSAMNYFFVNYCQNPPASIPEKLHDLFWKGFGTDAMLFMEVLTRYKNFVFDSSLSYMKIAHGKNLQFDLGYGSLAEIFKYFHYYMLTFKYICKLKWAKSYHGIKIFLGAEALSSAFIYFFRRGLRPSFLNFKESKGLIYEFFSEFSFFEIIAVIARSILRTAYRCFSFIVRKFIGRSEHKNEKFLFTRENFLDSEGRFNIS